MPRNPFRTATVGPAASPAGDGADPAPICPSVRHYFYFQSRDLAERAAERIRAWDCAVEIRQLAGGARWLALATQPVAAQAAVYQAMIRDFMAIALEAQRGAVASLAECRAGLARSTPTSV